MGLENLDNKENSGDIKEEKKSNGDTTFEYERETENEENEFELPEKFKGKSAEEIAKSYIELEKKLSGNNDNKNTDDNQDKEKNEQDKKEDNQDLTDLNNDKGTDENNSGKDLDFEQIEKEFLEGSEEKLPQEIKDKLKESGQSEFLINKFTNDLENKKSEIKTSTEEFTNSIYEKVGGRENYLELMNTVKDEMGQDEINDFISAVKNNNRSAVKYMVDNYINKFGNKKEFSAETGNKNNSGDTFKSNSEYREAMMSIKYQNNPDYARKIDEKAKRSGLFNF